MQTNEYTTNKHEDNIAAGIEEDHRNRALFDIAGSIKMMGNSRSSCCTLLAQSCTGMDNSTCLQIVLDFVIATVKHKQVT